MRVLIQLLALYLGGTPACAATTEATHFLSRGPGAEAAALGGAVLPLVSDPTALYWNPAALALAGGAISGEHLFLFGGARYNFVGLSLPSKLGTFGLGTIQLRRGGITARVAIDDPGTEVTNAQTAYLMGYATPLRRGWSAGAAANLLSYDLAGYRDMGLGLDLGLGGRWPPEGFSRHRRGRLRFGAAIKNLIEPSLKLDRDAERLPREFRWGAAWLFDVMSRIDSGNGAIRHDRAAVTAALRHIQDVPGLLLALGLSYTLHDVLVLRAGYDRGVAGGIGFRTFDGRFHMDYALENKPLSKNHRVTVSYRFAPVPVGARDAELVEHDDGYRTARNRANSLSEERFASGKTLFLEGRYAEAAAKLEEAAFLFPEDRERRRMFERALEAHRRESLKALGEAFHASLKAGRWEEAAAALGAMADFAPAPDQLVRLAAEASEAMGAELYDAYAAALAAAGRREVLARLGRGLLGAAVERSELIVRLEPRPGPGAPLDEWTRQEAARRRLALEEAARQAEDPRTRLEAALALRRAFPKDREADRLAASAARRYAPEPAIPGRERLHLRKLYYLAALRHVRGENAEAADLLEEILRRNAADADALALRERLAPAGAGSGGAWNKEER